jgi:2-(1,2-epoxy-1,2-dihydrophenyl)acetyl-CoA isomerase
LTADKALEWGLVNRVFADDELLEKAREMGHELAAGPTIALGLIRRLYWESSDNTYEEQLNLERQMQRKAGASADFKEGVRAFLQKRPANFKGA